SVSNVTGPPETRWHVLQTRSRQEKALARTLDAAGIEHYLPLTKRPRYRRGRKQFVEEPLFASYLFLHGPVEATYLAVATKRVANVIAVVNQSRLIDELDQIRRALDNGADLSSFGYLKAGRRARVSAGPFRGIEGLIEAWQKVDRLVLQIDALGRATSLEIDAGLLEPVD
ncbi:MAG: transcription termination/antitermination protein NusG, partial [Planctomycetota bacterium]